MTSPTSQLSYRGERQPPIFQAGGLMAMLQGLLGFEAQAPKYAQPPPARTTRKRSRDAGSSEP